MIASRLARWALGDIPHRIRQLSKSVDLLEDRLVDLRSSGTPEHERTNHGRR